MPRPLTSRSARDAVPGRFTALVVGSGAAVRDPVVRQLRGLGAREVAEATTVAEARLVASRGPRRLAVIELSLADGNGLALLDELRASGWPHGLLITDKDEAGVVRAALVAGARGLLVQRGPSRGVGPAIPLRGRGAVGAEQLSLRELEVLQLVADGQSNREVADALGLSALTVKSHLARIGRKLGTGDRAEMVALVLRCGLIS
ncbi:MAG: LuxR C-terminal-related transcriptional regulator [Actinomycetales bacterium]